MGDANERYARDLAARLRRLGLTVVLRFPVVIVSTRRDDGDTSPRLSQQVLLGEGKDGRAYWYWVWPPMRPATSNEPAAEPECEPMVPAGRTGEAARRIAGVLRIGTEPAETSSGCVRRQAKPGPDAAGSPPAGC